MEKMSKLLIDSNRPIMLKNLILRTIFFHFWKKIDISRDILENKKRFIYISYKFTLFF